MVKMGLQFGLQGGEYCKRSHHWMFIVDGLIGDEQAEMNALPPSKAARPDLTFKEISVSHLIEDVYYPAKPDWKPITITVFDLVKNSNPIWKWLKELYDPQEGIFNPPNTTKGPKEGFIRECSLNMLDGCGSIIESWIFEDCWPQATNFQTLDYAQSQIMMIDITIRYARAYVEEN